MTWVQKSMRNPGLLSWFSQPFTSRLKARAGVPVAEASKSAQLKSQKRNPPIAICLPPK